MAKKSRLVKGVLTARERDYIYNNKDKYSIEDLAAKLGKDIVQIRLCVQSFNSHKFLPEEEEAPSYMEIPFRKRLEYQYLVQQFTQDELAYFEQMYTRYITQFGGDVLASEERQIFQIIELDLFAQRNKKRQMDDENDKIKIEKAILAEEEKGPTEINQGLVKSLYDRLNTIQASRNTKLLEYERLVSQQKDLLKELKATRQQRIKAIEDASTSFIALIKSLEDPAIREQIGIDIEALRIATAKSIVALKEPHKYVNGEIDNPLLTGKDADDKPPPDELTKEYEDYLNADFKTENVFTNGEITPYELSNFKSEAGS